MLVTNYLGCVLCLSHTTKTSCLSWNPLNIPLWLKTDSQIQKLFGLQLKKRKNLTILTYYCETCTYQVGTILQVCLQTMRSWELNFTATYDIFFCPLYKAKLGFAMLYYLTDGPRLNSHKFQSNPHHAWLTDYWLTVLSLLHALFLDMISHKTGLKKRSLFVKWSIPMIQSRMWSFPWVIFIWIVSGATRRGSEL